MNETVNIANNKIFENTKDFTLNNNDIYINRSNILSKIDNNVNIIDQNITNNPYNFNNILGNKNTSYATYNLLPSFLISVRDPRNKGNEFFVKDNFKDNQDNYLFGYDDIYENLYFMKYVTMMMIMMSINI